MIHIKAYPPRILYQSPYRSAQISDLADIHLTFRFQAALPVIVSPAQRSSKTGDVRKVRSYFRRYSPGFISGSSLQNCRSGMNFIPISSAFYHYMIPQAQSFLFCQFLLFNLQPVLFPLYFPRHPSVLGFLHGIHPKVNLCCICNTSHSHFPAGTQCCTHYC